MHFYLRCVDLHTPQFSDRSPYLIMVGGISLLGLVALPTYLAAFALDETFPLDVYNVFYVSRFGGVSGGVILGV